MHLIDAFMQTGMADGCRVMMPGEAKAVAPELRLDGAQGVLHSPHELRIEPRTAIALLASWRNASTCGFVTTRWCTRCARRPCVRRAACCTRSA